MRDDLSRLDAFLAVAETRSFRAASERLGVTASAVSQTVRQLEDSLGLALFTRTTRSVALTEAGEHLFAGVRPAIADVRVALESLESLRGRPAGRLRLNVASIAEDFLGDETVAAFLTEHPEIKLDLAIDDDDIDLVADGFDAAIRLGEVIARDMVAVSVSGEQRQLVVGSPKYFGMEDTLRPYLERGELVAVLEKFCPPFPGFFLYYPYPSGGEAPPKLKALVDFLRKRMRPAKRRR